MKKLFLLFTICLLSLNMQAQTRDEKKVKIVQVFTDCLSEKYNYLTITSKWGSDNDLYTSIMATDIGMESLVRMQVSNIMTALPSQVELVKGWHYRGNNICAFYKFIDAPYSLSLIIVPNDDDCLLSIGIISH